MPQVVEAESGLVEFDATIPFTQNGNYNITAILTPSEGDPVQASTQVQIRSFTCALTVLPQPSGVGCDLGASQTKIRSLQVCRRPHGRDKLLRGVSDHQ